MTNKNLNNTIAFQGVPGAYSEMACLTNFKNMKTLACPSFEEMMKHMEVHSKQNIYTKLQALQRLGKIKQTKYKLHFSPDSI